MRIRNRIVKKVLSMMFSGLLEGSLEEQRVRQTGARSAPFPSKVQAQPFLVEEVPVEWFEVAVPKPGVILYLHGGAYVFGVTPSNRTFAAQIAAATGRRVLFVDYRLAPEHPFPAALDDVLTVYRWLLGQGVPAAEIIIGGDSAGGGLAIAALLALRDAADPLPAGGVCLSPWLDLALSGDSSYSKANADIVLDRESLQTYAGYYAAEHDLTHPLVSPLYADPAGLPPLLIDVGTEEVLLDDATRFAERVRQAGGDVTLTVWDEMVHVFHFLSFLPETKKAMAQIADFVAKSIGA